MSFEYSIKALELLRLLLNSVVSGFLIKSGYFDSYAF